MSDHVPFLDLVQPHRELEEEIISTIRQTLATAVFVGGPSVEAFEQEFADFCGTRYCIGLGSGTDALRFALIGAGIGKGDIVATTPNTFIATTEAISQAGASIAFVDVDESTSALDPAKLRVFLEEQCRRDPGSGRTLHRETNRPVTAVIPVHLYGQTADMDPIIELAEQHRLSVIEDACQAHGAAYYSRREKAWKTAGSMGKAAAFSFYPGKNLGACGEAGAVTTNDAQLAQTVRMLRDHGQMKKYSHVIEGYNGRLDAIQAGILRVKLRHLSEWNAKRRHLAARYNRLLAGIRDFTVPREPEWSKGVFHLYVVRHPKRSDMQTFLAKKNIGTALHYPVPLHLQQAYTGLGFKAGDFPVAERISQEILSLPMFPGLSEKLQIHVVESIKEFERAG